MHTGRESIIRPPAIQTDKEMPAGDLQSALDIGKLGVELTDYVLFSYRKLNDDIYVAHGDFATWTYEQLGLLVFCDELWDVRARGGKDYVELNEMNKERDLDGIEEAEIGALKWNDEALEGRGFVDWRPFEHPQLGAVELGGWDRILRNNAPPQLLEETCEKMARFLMAHAQGCAAVLSLMVKDSNWTERDTAIGQFDFNLSKIYGRKNHEYFQQWCALMDPTGDSHEAQV